MNYIELHEYYGKVGVILPHNIRFQIGLFNATQVEGLVDLLDGHVLEIDGRQKRYFRVRGQDINLIDGVPTIVFKSAKITYLPLPEKFNFSKDPTQLKGQLVLF